MQEWGGGVLTHPEGISFAVTNSMYITLLFTGLLSKKKKIKHLTKHIYLKMILAISANDLIVPPEYDPNKTMS